MHMPVKEFALNEVVEPPMKASVEAGRGWLVERLRGTNWAAAAIAAALQGGFLAVLIAMGVVKGDEPPPRKRIVTVLASVPPKSAAPAPPEPSKAPVVPPRAEVVAPVPKINVSAAPPVATTPERVPEQPSAAPAQAAPTSAPAPVAAAQTASGPVKVANLATSLLSGTPPTYPAESRRKREEGTVVLWVQIARDGRVSQVSVQRSSGFANLDEAALVAVRRWRWSATLRDGRPVEVEGAVRIPFVLRKS